MAEQLDLFPDLEPTQQGSIQMEESKIIEDAEWCFQFFNNEPVVFGWNEEGSSATSLVLQVESKESNGLTFQQNGMTFRIFPRPISEESKQQRKEEAKTK